MKPERMRVRIAEYLGWKVLPPHVVGEFDITGEPPVWESCRYHQVTDYPNDLNACHEMEKSLNGNGFLISMYQQNLEKLTTPEDAPLVEIKNWMFHATAHQRSEAFCRTVGIWEDEPITQPTS